MWEQEFFPTPTRLTPPAMDFIMDRWVSKAQLPQTNKSVHICVNLQFPDPLCSVHRHCVSQSLPILTRSADIRKATKADPLQITNDNDNNVHPEDWKMLPKCIEFIERVARGEELGGDGNHWLLYCSINIPHPAFQTNATWLSYVNDNKVAVPKVLPREIMHPADSYMSISKSVWRNFTDDEILKVRKTYLAMCAETDYMLGEVIAALDRAGLRNDTVIIFLSDHGEMNMEHRQVWKNSMKEASARVPLVLSGPGMRSGAVVTELTSLLDVLPTLVTLGGGRVEDFGPLSGVSLLPLLLPQGPAEKERAFFAERTVDAEYHSNMGNVSAASLCPQIMEDRLLITCLHLS